MKRQIPRAAHVLVALVLVALGCQSKTDLRTAGAASTPRSLTEPDFDASSEVRVAKTMVPGELLLRMMQFDAPYRGYFQELRLYRDGLAVTFPNVPNSAPQVSHRGTLGKSALAQVQRRLATVDLTGYSASSEPEPAGLHTVLIFFDGRAYQRRNFNGRLPARIQAPIDVIQEAIKVAPGDFEKYLKANEAAKEEARILHDGLGWNVPKDLRLSPLKDVRGLLLTVRGVRGDAATSVYHALVFYPEGKLVHEPIGPANWPDNPRAEVRLMFGQPNGPSGIGIKTVTHELVIDHRLIENKLIVGSNAFPLAKGNLFVMQFDKNWMPVVRAIPTHVDGRLSASAVLEAFKAQLETDGVIQSLSLAR
jgi:hypothetical protein